MSYATGTVIESQVDWLTCSAHGRERAHGLAWLSSEWAKGEAARGNRLQKWRLMGYEGSHVGRVRWGQRDEDSCLVQLSGELAERYIAEAASLADRVTRVDLAVTVRPDPPNPHLGANVYDEAAAFAQGKPRAALPWTIYDARGGRTTYLGARTSDHFLRVYNKEAESRAKDDAEGVARYLGCWRTELELKGMMAEPVARVACDQEDRPAWAQEYLYDYLTDHGITSPFPRPALG